MKKYVVKNFEVEQFERLIKDIEEVEIVLEMPGLKEGLIFDSQLKNLYIDLPASTIKYMKKIIFEELWPKGELCDNSLGEVLMGARPTKDYTQELQDQVRLLKEETVPFYARARGCAYPALTLEVQQLHYSTILQTLIGAGHKRFVLAEGSHAFYAPKKFIMDNIDFLKEINAVVVIENFVSEAAQVEMNRCVEKKHYSAALRHMTPSFTKLEMHQEIRDVAADAKYQMMQMLCANGIAIVAGDNETSQSLPANQDRLIVGNYIMIKNTDTFIQAGNHGKEPVILYFTGSSHAVTTHDVAGVSELTGAVVLELHDEYAKNKPSSITLSKHPMSVVIKRNIADLMRAPEPVAAASAQEPTLGTMALSDILREFNQAHPQRRRPLMSPLNPIAAEFDFNEDANTSLANASCLDLRLKLDIELSYDWQSREEAGKQDSRPWRKANWSL